MEIERFRRNFRPPGCLRTIYDNFSKNFQKWRPFWIFEFSPKMRKHKIFTISLTVGDKAISAKFSTPRVFKNYIWQLFKKFSKMAAILNFRIFAKNGKQKIFAISLTVGDRAISAKFSTPRVFKNYIWQLFKKFSNMAAILNFRIFAKNGKHKIFAISLTVGDRAISAKFSTPRVFKNYIWQLFKKFSKMAAILNFRIFAKNAKT